jgi:hypothetical protein
MCESTVESEWEPLTPSIEGDISAAVVISKVGGNSAGKYANGGSRTFQLLEPSVPILRERGVVRNLLIKAQTCKPNPHPVRLTSAPPERRCKHAT